MLPLVASLAIAFQVQAVAETEPVPHAGDAADDAGIWIDPVDPARSTVIGTDKRGGLGVYDLQGRELQYLADGDKNNVDVRYGFPLDGRDVDLVVAGDPGRDALAVYRVEPATRQLAPAGQIDLDLGVYGSCLYKSAKDGALYAFVTSKDGLLEQWKLEAGAQGAVAGRRVRSVRFEGKIEGCVADDELAALYVSEEERGIWRLAAEPDGSAEPVFVDGVESGHLEPDIEGLAILRHADGTGYLLASSQGADAFVIYERREGNRYVGTFQVGGGSSFDGAEETDGIEVTATPMGDAFPAGMLVVQNGINDHGNQSFLLVPWHSVTSVAGLAAAPGSDPRAKPRVLPARDARN